MRKRARKRRRGREKEREGDRESAREKVRDRERERERERERVGANVCLGVYTHHVHSCTSMHMLMPVQTRPKPSILNPKS